MIFTKEQYNEIGRLYFDDLPISDDYELGYYIFNKLPKHIQGSAISFCPDDTEVRDDIFMYLLQKLYNIQDAEIYYKNIYKEHFIEFNTIKDIEGKL